MSYMSGAPKRQPAEPLLQHDIPQRPWQTVGTDMFRFDGAEYLIIADYYSKYPFIRRVHGRCTSATVVHLTKQVFGEQGIPTRVISDNGPHFDSRDYRKFASDWGFDHVTSSPRYPRSNGFIERAIQTVKATLQKTQQSDGHMDLDLAMLCLRTTPIDSVIPSPAEMLYGRKLRSNLPVKIPNNIPSKDEIQQRLLARQHTQKEHHDKHGVHALPPLSIGQSVSLQDQESGRWIPAVVKDKCMEPRSYLVVTPNGKTLRRNRSHLRSLAPAKKKVRFDDDKRIATQGTSKEQNCAKSDVAQTQSSHGQTELVTDSSVNKDKNSDLVYHTRSGRAVRKPPRLIES